MTGEDNSNVIGVRTVYDAVLRLEGTIGSISEKFDARTAAVDARVDTVMLKQERLEGRLEGGFSMVKWIGPVGLAALVMGLLVLFHVIPVAPT